MLSCVFKAMYIYAKERKGTFGKEVNLDMFKEKFGIEIEFTGITRNKASKVVAELSMDRLARPETITTQRNSKP